MRNKHFLFLLAFISFQSLKVSAQWDFISVPGVGFYNNGKIGIGTSTPGALLSLGAGNGGKRLLVYENAGSNVRSGFGIDMSGSSRELTLFHSTSNNVDGNISFGRLNEGIGTYTENMRITGDGKVGLGVNQPKARLELPNEGTSSLRLGIVGNIANTYTQLLNTVAVT